MPTSLFEQYNARYQAALVKDQLTLDDLKSSRSLFEDDSLETKLPIPKKLDVVCIVCGLPLPESIINQIESRTSHLSGFLPLGNMYLVKQYNLAIELLVLKWPEECLNKSLEDSIVKYLETANYLEAVSFESNGLQFHDDGALIYRCIDVNNSFRRLRKQLINLFPAIPSKQSNWAHIPIGRLLKPINSCELTQLKLYCNETQEPKFDLKFECDNLKLIHEKRWYQEEREQIYMRTLK